MLDPFAPSEAGHDFALFVLAIGRDDQRDALTDGFGSGVAEDAFGFVVPRSDGAVQRLADDHSCDDSTIAARRLCVS